MKEEITDEQLIAFIEGEKNEALKNRLTRDPDLSKRYQELKEVLDTIADTSVPDVPEHIRSNFQDAIAVERQKQNRSFTWLQVAAAIALLIIGYSVGKVSDNSTGTKELVSLKNEIQLLKEVTMTSALQQYTASERIMAVNNIENESKSRPEFTKALVNTFNSDESPNVRYAALQALSNFIDKEEVRAELVKSLETQQDPLIQISLISVLMEASEKSAIAPLKDIITQEKTSPEVKQQAKIALEILT